MEQLLINPAFVTPVGIVLAMVMLLLTGWLVPKWQVNNLIAENRHLRETVKLLAESVDDFSDAAKAQTQTGEIVKTVMTTLQNQATKQRGESGN